MPIRPVKAQGVFVTDPNARGKATIISPTQADQIPVSRVDQTTGLLQYEPVDYPLSDPAFTDPANIGKALTIVAGSTGGSAKIGLSDVVEKDDAVSALIDQNGLITYPTITVVNNNTIHVTAFKAHFSTSGTNTIVDIPEKDIVITKANSGVDTDDVTYLLLQPDGTFQQTYTRPTSQQQQDLQYIAEIIHTDGGPVSLAKPLFTIYSNLQKQNRDLFSVLGLNGKNFAFSFDRNTGHLSQTSATAEIIGYIISSDQTNPDVVSFPVANTLDVRYYSFNPADRLATLTDFRKSYNVDNILAGTSTAIANGNFGILSLYADIGGKYTVIAPQKSYTSLADAQNDRLLYLSSILLPTFFGRNNVLVASIIVSNTVTSATSTTFDIALIKDLVFTGGAVSCPASSLPDPSSASPDDVVVVDPTSNSFVIRPNTINTSASISVGDIYVSDGTKFQPTSPANINSNTLGLFSTMHGISFVKFVWDTSASTTTTQKVDPNNYFTNCTLSFSSTSSAIRITTVDPNIVNQINPIVAYLIPITDASTVDNFMLSIRSFAGSAMTLYGGNLSLVKIGKAYELILFFHKYV